MALKMLGSTVLGCPDLERREARQAACSTRHLAMHALAHEEDRPRLARMARLVAPLGRPLKADEAVVRVEPAISRFSTDHAVDAEPRDRPVSAAMADGSPILDMPPTYKVIPGPCVTDFGYVCGQNRFFLEGVQFVVPGWETGDGHPWFHANPPFEAFDPADRTAILWLDRRPRQGAVFVFSAQNAGVNFGHFVHDFLIQVPMYRRVQALYPGLKGLIPKPFSYPIQTVLLDWVLGREREAGLVLQEDFAGLYETAICPNLQFSYTSPGLNIGAAQAMRKTMANLARTQVGARPLRARKVFVSRRDRTSDAYDRDQIDSDALEAMFRTAGFDIVAVADLAPPEILDTFGEAAIVAGVHGAGLMNVMFSLHERARVIELDPISPAWSSIERFVKACGIDHERHRPQMNGGRYDYAHLGPLIG